MEIKELIKNIEAWGIERELDKKGTVEGQQNGDYREDNLNTILCNLIGICKVYDMTFVECVESAYNEIANRKGKMINGTFVKEEDLEN